MRAFWWKAKIAVMLRFPALWVGGTAHLFGVAILSGLLNFCIMIAWPAPGTQVGFLWATKFVVPFVTTLSCYAFSVWMAWKLRPEKQMCRGLQGWQELPGLFFGSLLVTFVIPMASLQIAVWSEYNATSHLHAVLKVNMLPTITAPQSEMLLIHESRISAEEWPLMVRDWLGDDTTAGPPSGDIRKLQELGAELRTFWLAHPPEEKDSILALGALDRQADRRTPVSGYIDVSVLEDERVDRDTAVAAISSTAEAFIKLDGIISTDEHWEEVFSIYFASMLFVSWMVAVSALDGEPKQRWEDLSAVAVVGAMVFVPNFQALVPGDVLRVHPLQLLAWDLLFLASTLALIRLSRNSFQSPYQGAWMMINFASLPMVVASLFVGRDLFFWPLDGLKQSLPQILMVGIGVSLLLSPILRLVSNRLNGVPKCR